MSTPVAVSSVSLELTLSIIALSITVISGLWGYFKVFLGIERRLVMLETKTELWWNTVADQVKHVIMQPIHFRKDDLLTRFPNITDKELLELKEILTQEVRNLKNQKDPKVAVYAIWRARVELECLNRGKDFKSSILSRLSKIREVCGQYLFGKGSKMKGQ
jgi:hypothetical protein